MKNYATRIRKTLLALQDSLMKLLEEVPLSDITVKELCEGANISRATFYRYFKSVEDMIPQIEKELLFEFSGVMNRGKNISDIAAVIRDVSFTVYERREYLSRVMRTVPDILFHGKLREVLKRIFISEIKIRMPDAGTIKTDSVAEYCVGGLLSLYEKWISTDFYGQALTVGEFADSAAVLVLSTINSVCPEEKTD